MIEPRGMMPVMGKRRLLFFLGAMVLAGCSTVPTEFHPAQPIAPADFDHQTFDAVLQAHVHDGVVDYPAIAADPRFSRYVQQLNRVDPDALPTERDRLAFWINAYNAFAIKGILDGYSPRTLIGRYRYFIAHEHQVGGEAINLYDLEQQVLIPEFREPRIHFAIVCASRSCPRLKTWAYVPDRLEEQLSRSARDFVNDPSRNRFDQERHVAYLSRIFDWFEEDFAAEAGSLLRYVARYVSDPELARRLEQGRYHVEFLDYDWSLNGLPLDGADDDPDSIG